MDLGSFSVMLAIVSLVTYGLVDRVKAAFPKVTTMQIVGISLVLALVVPFVLKYSTFAEDIEVGKRTLDDINTWGLIFIGLLGAGGASVVNQLIGSGGSKGTHGALGNIGDNEPPPAPPT